MPQIALLLAEGDSRNCRPLLGQWNTAKADDGPMGDSRRRLDTFTNQKTDGGLTWTPAKRGGEPRSTMAIQMPRQGEPRAPDHQGEAKTAGQESFILLSEPFGGSANFCWREAKIFGLFEVK